MNDAGKTGAGVAAPRAMGASAAPEHVVFEEGELGLLKRIQRVLHANPTAVPFIVLLLGIALFSVIVGRRFFHPFNLSLVLQQVTIIGTVGIAQTLIILTAGIDLSVGAITVLSSVVMGRLAVLAGVPIEIAFALGLLTGIACGAVNGALVTYLKLPPFIVTLGTWSIFGALNLWYSQSQTIRQQEIEASAPFLQWTGTAMQVGAARLTYGSILMVLIAVLVWYMLNRTAFGRHIYATGDAPELGTAGRHQHPPHAAGRLHARRPHLLRRRLGADRPHRRHQRHLGRHRQPRFDHRGRHRRHQPLRRPRLDRRHAGGGPDRRRVPERPGAGRCRRPLAGVHHRRPDHRRGLDRPVAPEALLVSGEGLQPILMARGLVKRYGRVTALDHADFDLLPGEILGVIGDNGAGKSTLIKTLAGAVTPDHGEIRLDGRPVHFRSPLDARAAGIETVYQDLALSPALSVADNLFLGRERRRPDLVGRLFRTLDRAGMRSDARRHLNALGLLTIQSVGQAVETLSGGQRQGVAVVRATAFGSRVVIMDEPTAALGVKESRKVLELIVDVKRRGLPIVLISHNMPHVFEVADRIHIHRLGRRIAVIRPAEFSMSDAVAIMTGAMAPPEAQEAA